MSEGSVSSNLIHGVPLASVRSAFFRNKAQTLWTLRRLIHNGVETVFSTADDGAVVMDGSYLNWQFISPTGAFSVSDFEGETVGGFFDVLIAYCEENAVRSWEEFAGFLAQEGSVNMINQVFSQVVAAEVTAPGMAGSIPFESVPTFSAPANFAGFLAWVKSILPVQMQARPAAELQANAEGGTYSFGVTMSLVLAAGEGSQNAAMSFSFML